MKEVPVENATIEQLAQYAAANLGIEVDGRSTPNTILARMRAAGFEGNVITVQDHSAPSKSAVSLDAIVKGEKIGDGKSLEDRKMMITIAENPAEPGGSEPVFLGNNGRGIYVPRGEMVTISAKYLDPLRHAIKGVAQVDNGRLVGMREVPYYPFTFHGFVD